MAQLQPSAQWSSAIEEADWIAPQLTAATPTVTAVVPKGYESYARLLHPAETSSRRQRLVRWREVAAWSGSPLGPEAQFHTVAFPKHEPATDAPWSGQGPRERSLDQSDAEALSKVLRGFTASPDECFFCIWTGYGWDNRRLFTTSGKFPSLSGSIPEAVRRYLRVHLPRREYLLYTGGVESIIATAAMGDGQTANLVLAGKSLVVCRQRDRPGLDLRGRNLGADQCSPHRRSHRSSPCRPG